MTLLVDSHCHIPLLEADMPVEAIISKARDMGVGYMLCASVDLESYPRVLALAREYDVIYAAVGVHPNTSTDREPGVDELVKLAAERDVVGIGETGLDYFRSRGDLDWQRERFRTHIRTAIEVNKPLIIHSREARDDVMKILKEEGAGKVGGVMHCFVDDWDTARQALELNFYISFSGIVTFNNTGEVKAVARKVPLDRILVETDSPYLAPVPYRGKKNQPAYVYYVASHIAGLREMEEEEFVSATTRNFFQLFPCANKIN